MCSPSVPIDMKLSLLFVYIFFFGNRILCERDYFVCVNPPPYIFPPLVGLFSSYDLLLSNPLLLFFTFLLFTYTKRVLEKEEKKATTTRKKLMCWAPFCGRPFFPVDI